MCSTFFVHLLHNIATHVYFRSYENFECDVLTRLKFAAMDSYPLKILDKEYPFFVCLETALTHLKQQLF